MNYLAHAFLSGNNEKLLVGNFIADHIRGNQFDHFSPDIIDGIVLHRQIDTFTDAHPAFKACKRCFYNGFERHSGILVDIYFDYFLAKDFSDYSKVPLPQFSENVYAQYRRHQDLLPLSSARFLDYVTNHNIYVSYASLQGIEQVLTHLSHRIQHRVALNASIKLFKEHEEVLQSNFNTFFKELCLNFRIII